MTAGLSRIVSLRAWAAGALLVANLSLAGCAPNPATGRESFTGFMSTAEEARVGREQHPKVMREFGGEYADPALQRYVSQVGDALARHTELPDLKFTFTVLNSDIVNAFALPGGYVYVTRGLVALAGNEAELAGVLGHEMGHVAARHSAERYSAAVAGQLGVAVLGVLLGGAAADVGGQVGQLALASYSRSQESEADLLGIRYLARSGYDVNAMASFLAKLQAESAFSAELAGRSGASNEFSLLQSHPRTADRVREAIAVARDQGVRGGGRLDRDEYLQAIDGMWYGGDPANGFVRGRRFIHPALGFLFEVPAGFHVFNAERSVAARGPNGARINFDADSRAQTAGLAMADYIRDAWARGRTLSGLESIDVNGLPAATATTRLSGNSGTFDVRLLAVRFDEKTIYRFLFASRPADAESLSAPFRRTTYSFRRLGAEEARTLRPLRLRVVAVRAGDTVDSLARQMALDEHQRRRFELLNGLASGDAVRPGDKVKLVVD